MRLKQNDTKPDLVVNLTADDEGTPAILTTALSIRIIGKRSDGSAVFDDMDPGRENGLGRVTHLWNPSETADLGRILVEVEVTWQGGWVQSFPPDHFLTVDVVPDLD